MNNLLTNKKFLIVGAGGLLGAEVVKKALQQGAAVIAADIKLDVLKAKLQQQEVDINSKFLSLVELDVTNKTEVVDFFSKQVDINGAVNCSYPRNKSYGSHFFDVSLEDFNENVALHLGSAFLFSQQCAAYFSIHKTPFSLVNISSVYGVVAPKFDIYKNTPMTMPVEYSAIKSAIIHLNKYIVSYINDSRFRINSVSPGGIFDKQNEIFLEAYKKNTLGRGMLDVDEVIGSILFLISDQSQFVNAQNIVVDDGFTL